MPRTNFQDLLDAGVHFGHLKRKWNPKMAPYIFMEKNGIHIIDLHKTIVKIDQAANVAKQFAKAGRKILFVATKKQAKDIVAEAAKSVNMPYVTERWPGGMLTNFPTIRKAVKKMNTIDKMMSDGTFETLAKRERLQVTRQRAKLEKNLGSIADLNRLPAALFIVDIQKEVNAVREASRLNIPIIAMVDTCCDPTPIDYVIPANDDAAKSIALIIEVICQAINEGLEERKLEKDKEIIVESSEEKSEILPVRRTRARRQRVADEDKTPANKEEETPAKEEKTPAKKEEAAVKETPAKEEKTPAKEKAAAVEEVPVKEEKTPAKKEEAAVKETPVKEEAPVSETEDKQPE
ncbi:MAG: 30S ribosomal protein S2 [Bacteroidetes bacterium ADurb.Bin037]|nr:MAG: 30S ribosomal protein S2 [Bacteroidetes bacterium ADurb.Bin037]HPW79114.1 30S ribosomal protein S2 [Bacteroidales bacterium]HQB56123.1 30S ribosomal protein S2 [Bacteroidales bacterium]